MTSTKYLKLKVGSGKNIDISVPINAKGDVVKNIKFNGADSSDGSAEEKKETVLRSLHKKYFDVDDVVLGDETSIKDRVLTIRKDIVKDAIEATENILDVKMKIIHPNELHQFSETIMDIQPMAAKYGEDSLGTGTTNILGGAVMMVTGVTEDGFPVGEFGSSEGYIDENMLLGRPGCADEGEILINIEGTIASGTNMVRSGPYAIHAAANYVAEEIRKELKKLDPADADREEYFEQVAGRKHRIVIVKEIMGQGAMHDHVILPNEPIGLMGGVSNIDLGNLPVNVSPLEVLDGAVHSMTCVGPGSKEVSRHFFREPLVELALQEEDFEIAGVVLIGSSQINTEKYYSSKRLGMMLEAIKPDGVIITTEGFGNNHIDFASHHEQAGMRNIPAVGCSFCAMQGALVVGNESMKNMIELNKSELGVENEVLGINTLCKEDAIRALTMMKSVIEGKTVQGPDRKWNQDTIKTNLDNLEKVTGNKIDRVPNETSIPLSEKRIKKYGLKEEK